MKIIQKIYYKEPKKLGFFIMEIVSDLQELINNNSEDGEIPILIKKQNEITEEIKDKNLTIENLKDNLRKNKNINAIKLTNEINKIENEINQLDQNLFNLMGEETAINLRIIRMCIFLIKFCKSSSQCKKNE